MRIPLFYAIIKVTLMLEAVILNYYIIGGMAVVIMRYKFGANHLYIGEAIYNVLKMLEKRYGISFNDLEANHLKKESEK